MGRSVFAVWFTEGGSELARVQGREARRSLRVGVGVVVARVFVEIVVVANHCYGSSGLPAVHGPGER
jgi:hypothetical protein